MCFFKIKIMLSIYLIFTPQKDSEMLRRRKKDCWSMTAGPTYKYFNKYTHVSIRKQKKATIFILNNKNKVKRTATISEHFQQKHEAT